MTTMSKGQKIDILKSYGFEDGCDPAAITITVELLQDIEQEALTSLVVSLWPKFQGTEPDSDSQFGEYLTEKRPELFKDVEGNFTINLDEHDVNFMEDKDEDEDASDEFLVVIQGKATDKQIAEVERIVGHTSAETYELNGNTDVVFYVSDEPSRTIFDALDKLDYVESMTWQETE